MLCGAKGCPESSCGGQRPRATCSIDQSRTSDLNGREETGTVRRMAELVALRRRGTSLFALLGEGSVQEQQASIREPRFFLEGVFKIYTSFKPTDLNAMKH